MASNLGLISLQQFYVKSYFSSSSEQSIWLAGLSKQSRDCNMNMETNTTATSNQTNGGLTSNFKKCFKRVHCFWVKYEWMTEHLLWQFSWPCRTHLVKLWNPFSPFLITARLTLDVACQLPFSLTCLDCERMDFTSVRCALFFWSTNTRWKWHHEKRDQMLQRHGITVFLLMNDTSTNQEKWWLDSMTCHCHLLRVGNAQKEVFHGL